MSYYLIEISKGDSKIAGKAIYEYTTANEATANFHKKLGTAMASDLYESDLLYITDDNGQQLKREKYTKPLPVYTVSFSTAHGTAPTSQSITQGEHAINPGTLIESGYSFVGWFTSAEGSTVFDFANTAITADTVIYAHWVTEE